MYALRPAYWLLACLSLAHSDNERLPHEDLPAHGTIYQGRLYGFFGPRRDGPILYAIRTDRPGIPTKEFDVHILLHTPFRFRHAIVNKHFWGHGGPLNDAVLVPAKDMHYFDLADNAEGYQLYKKRYPQIYEAGFIPPHSFDLGPQLAKAYDDDFRARYRENPRTLCAYDLAPTAATACAVFILAADKTMHPFRREGRWDAKAERWAVTVGKAEPPFPVPFCEEFYAFVRKDVFYFLTASGKLYRAPEPASGRPRAVEEAWCDKKYPIVAVIDDADAGKTYLFAKNTKEGSTHDFYFELESPGRFDAFARASLKPARGTPPLKMLLEYTQVLGRMKER